MYKECKVCGRVKYFGHGKGAATTCDDCIEAGKKWCKVCGTTKNVADFVGYPVTTRSECKECYAKKQASRRSTAEGREASRTANKKCCAKPGVRQAVYKRRRERYATDATYREKQKQISRDWHNTAYAENESYRKAAIIRTQNRRAEVSTRGTITKEVWFNILHEFGNACAYCGATEGLTVEHVLAIHNGGSNTACNVIPACKSCNSSKGTRLLEEWYPFQPFYNEVRLHKILNHLNHLKGGI